MKKMYRFLFITLVTICISVVSGCGESKQKHKPVFVGGTSEDTTLYTGEIISIPYEESSSSMKVVRVRVNGVLMRMTFDTGSAISQLSMEEAKKLIDRGDLTESDFKENGNFRLADGSIVENMIVNLKDVVLDDKLQFHDVEASISSKVNSAVLLGNELIDRAASYEIDTEKKVIRFKLKKRE